MEWLFIIALGAVLFKLWGRVDGLERQLADSQAREISQRAQQEASDDEDPPEQLTRPASAPTSDPDSPAIGPPIGPAIGPPIGPAIAPAAAYAMQQDPALSEGMEAATDAAESEPADPPAPRFALPQFALPKFDFEDIFGRRLPIWAGGIALAAGGIFLVIYAIEQGLMGPTTRVAISFIFGLLLLGAAEAAYRFEERVADPRVRQALAGAGLATLYAAFYLAGAQYGLIGPGVAFAGLAMVTAGALVLTSRFGLPTALLALVGGFATPVLVASDEANVPVLAFYLALLTAGLALTARRLGQRWLGAAGLVGGFVWGVLMLLGNSGENAEWIAIGLYLLALGAAVPLLLEEDEKLPVARLVSGGIAAVQMGVLVGLAGHDLLTWGLYLLLAAALAVLAWRDRRLRPAGVLVAAVGIILLALWPEPATREFVLVAGAFGAIVLGTPLVLLWRKDGDLLELAQLGIGALALGWVCHFHFGSYDNSVFLPGLSATFALLCAIAGLGAWRAWQDERLARLFALPAGISALLGFGAFHVLLPDWAEVIGAVAVSLVLAELLRRRQRKALASLVWAGGLLTLVTLFSTGSILEELARAVGGDYGEPQTMRALIRWIAATLPFAALALLEWRRRLRRLAEVLAGLVSYVVLAQVIPGIWLAWTAAACAIGLAFWQRRRTGLWGVLLAVALLWSLVPLAIWSGNGIEALGGQPMLAANLPDWDNVLRHVLPLALAAGAAAWWMAARRILAAVLAGLAAVAGTIVLHVLYKQIFAVGGDAEFVRLGMAERTIWQALLAGGGIALARFVPRTPFRQLGNAITTVGLWHFTLFTLLLHNPLWSMQATGALPIGNWLAPAYLVAGACVWWLTSQPTSVLRERLRPLGDGVLMLLVAVWALSELRHAFAGNVLTSVPMTQSEDLLRSLLGIVLALGFLWWGSRAGQRSWRIGSLVLMVLAVLKVFLVDAAGLEGLLRIASFLALGASLIGIGWVYSRQLSRRGEPVGANPAGSPEPGSPAENPSEA